MKCLILSAFVVLNIAAVVCTANCQIGSATEAAAKDLVEVMLRDGGRQAATELAEWGGQAAVRDVLERAVREGGEELAERAAQYGTRYGPSALKAIERSPARMIRALDQIPRELIEPAIRAAAREPGLTARLVGAYGKNVLELAAKHPGVGTRLAGKLGANGIRVGKTLSTDQAVMLARYADDIAALPAGERNQLLEAIMKAPARVLSFLEGHPKVLLTAGGVAAVIAAKDNLFGPTSSSTNHEAPPGLVGRMIFSAGHKLADTINVVIVIIVVGVLAYVTLLLRSGWRMESIRFQQKKAQVAAEINRQSKVSDADRDRRRVR